MTGSDKTTDLGADAPNHIPRETVENERRAIEKHGRLHFVHWLVVLLSAILTISVWQYSKHQIALRTEARFDFAASQVAELIEERLQKYELALWAGVSSIQTHGGDVNHEQWRVFARNLDIEHRYPGINGIGVIHEIDATELSDYLSIQRAARPGFNIHPPHGSDIYQPITYIEPVATNAAAVGLDMVHEMNRHKSLNKARDTATAQITGPIVLVQDETRTSGFLFFAPFYRDTDDGTVGGRAASFSGAVYAPFVVTRLMQGVLDKDRRDTAIRISDGDEIIYDEIHAGDSDYDQKALGEKRIQMSLYGREWTLDVRAGLGFREENEGFESTAILIVGIAIDVALLALFILLSRANRRGLRFADMATNALENANKDLDIARKEAEGISEMKSVFLSTMSHEVRTPLTAISGILELLDRADLPEKPGKLVEAGKTASDKLIKLLTDVLDVSRLDAEAVTLWEREIEVQPMVAEWRQLTAGMIEKRKTSVSVKATVADGIPDTILVDDVRLSQVMNNLLDNATRFTESGTITIKAFPWATTSDGVQRLGFSVTDTGGGIADSDIKLIFERFRQVDGSMTRESGGAGLGLSICHELVNLMGGQISVTSSVGVGTTFEIVIPIAGATSKGAKVA